MVIELSLLLHPTCCHTPAVFNGRCYRKAAVLFRVLIDTGRPLRLSAGWLRLKLLNVSFSVPIDCRLVVNESSALESRLIAIETQLMHLQHDFEQLNAECLRQQSVIQQQQGRMNSLESQLRALTGGGDSSSQAEE